MPYPDWRAGQKLKASLLRAMNVYQVVQGTDASKTSSTTLTSTNLVIPVESDALYEYRLLLVHSSGAGDMQVEWDVPSGTSMQRHGMGIGANNTGSQTNVDISFSAQGTNTTDFNIGGNGGDATAKCSFVELGYIDTGSSSGNVTLQYAQDNSNATASIVRAESSVFYRRIG